MKKTAAVPPPLTWRARLAVLLFGTILALVSGEVLLWVISYNPGIPIHERDLRYGWRNVRGASAVVCHDGPTVSINSLGFRGKEFAAKKTPGSLRVFTLGCSCTIGANVSDTETYAAQWERLLNQPDVTRHPVEVINAGVGGYSTEMGKAWLRHEIINYEPDLITLYYGWNDHWPARLGGSDRELSSATMEKAKFFLFKSRIIQLLYQLRSTELVSGWEGALRSAVASPGAAPDRQAALASATSGRDVTLGYRVPILEYEENLREMISLATENRSAVILIAAPLQYAITEQNTAYDVTTVPFVDGTDAPTVIANHRLYTNVLRRVGKETGTPVADLEKVFNLLTQLERDRLFYDYIHPNAEGFALLTEELNRTLQNNYPELLQ